jgi:hypothetical protein
MKSILTITRRTITRLTLAIVFSICAAATANAQLDTTGKHGHFDTSARHHMTCGDDKDFMLQLGLDGSGKHFSPGKAKAPGFTPPPPTPVGGFSPTAIMTCGKFAFYLEDVNASTGSGFDDPSLGVFRQNTLCDVATYIQSQFDFSLVSSSDLIKIDVLISYDNYVGYHSPITTQFYAAAGPYFNVTPNSIIGGFVNDYATSSVDPAPGNYHGQLIVNFDMVYPTGGWPTPVNFQADNVTYAAFPNCDMDLYSVLLHEMTHAMGWISLVYYDPSAGAINTPPLAVYGTNTFSKLDYSMQAGTVFPGTSLTKLILGPPTAPLLNSVPATYCNNNMWLNGSAAPDNHGVFSGQYVWLTTGVVPSYLSHLDDQCFAFSDRERISPGDRLEYVMGPYGIPGMWRRTYTKGEIQELTNVMNYNYIGGNPYVIPNHVPYSQKMAGYSAYMGSYGWFPETVAADYPVLVNSGAASQLVSMAALTGPDLVDADGDPIYVDVNSIINFRGCGNGGNNHAQLTPVYSGPNCIGLIYTPRANFYGRAQFGFNITDGKDEGAFYLVTIDVAQGTNVTALCTPGSNLVINGDFEEGSEVKKLGADEVKLNTTSDEDDLHEGKLNGTNFTDGHPWNAIMSNLWFPFGGGDAIHNSFYDCGSALIGKMRTGTFTDAYPGLGWFVYPNPPAGGERYAIFNGGTGASQFYNMTCDAQNCHRYILEMDAQLFGVSSPAPASIIINFKDNTSPYFPSPVYNFSCTTGVAPVAAIPNIGSSWVHLTIPFWYCGTLPSHILNVGDNGTPGTFLIDNINLHEDLTPPALTATISSATLPGCITELTANPVDAACNVTYLWSTGATTQVIDVTPTLPTTYTVTINDGCRTTTASITVPGGGVPSPITGPTTVCSGETITLTDADPGGTWTSSNTFVATVDAGGDVTGGTVGTAIISYTTPCGTATIIVNVIKPLASCVCNYVSAGNSFTELGAGGVIAPGVYTGNYFINGPVTVTGPGLTTFSNCVIAIASGATITVSSGSKLLIEGSHLFSCFPDMWQGIVLSTTIFGGGSGPTGQLEITSGMASVTSMIEDAMVAVDIPNPVAILGYTTSGASPTRLTLYSHGCTFNENMIGIRISGYSVSLPVTSVTAFHPSYPFVIENTVFTCRDFTTYSSSVFPTPYWPFAWPSTIGFPDALKTSITPATPYYPPYYLDIGYAQSVCNNGVLSQLGIDLEKVAFESGPVGSELYSAVVNGGPTPGGDGNLNLFDNMDYGIFAHNSNLISRNSGFMNMYPIPQSGGDGILALNDNGGKYQLYVFGDFTGNYTNSFWNTVNCVESYEYYDVKGVNAVMSSEHGSGYLADPQGQFGYKISSSNYYELQTNYTTIYNITNGISITTATPSSGSPFLGQVTADDNVISAVNPFGGTPLYNEYVNQAIDIENLVVPIGGPIFTGAQENVDNNTIGGVYNGILVDNCNTLQGLDITTQSNTVSVAQNPLLGPGNPNQTGICHLNTAWDYVGSNYVTGPGYNIPTPPYPAPYISTPLIEGIHVENVVNMMFADCNVVSGINTGFYFGGNNVGLQWFDNDMDQNAYGYVLNGTIGQQGAKPQPCDNTWTPAGFWVAPLWQTYTLNTTDAALSTLFMVGADPTLNTGEAPSLPYNWSTFHGLKPAGGSPLPCTAPPSSVVPVATRSAHSGGTTITPPVKEVNGTLAVIPNPNIGTFELKGLVPEMATSNEVTFEVVDMLGRTLYSEVSPISNGVIDKKIIMSDNIANGVYFIKVKSDAVSKVLRFTLSR